ncbi:MAG: hypothetical protein GY765_41135, partial [bacterium]|nr:hypothetical protein [bacterium]
MRRITVLLFTLIITAHMLGAIGVAELKNIRYYTYKEYTRVVLDLSAPLEVTEKTLPGTDKTRLYFDMERCRFAPGCPLIKKKEITVKTRHLQRIRIAKKSPYSIRVVFDFNSIRKHSKFYLTTPFRIVFDVFQKEERKKVPPLSIPTNPKTIQEDKPVKRKPVNSTTTSPKHKPTKTTGSKKDTSEPGKRPDMVGRKYSLVRQLGLGVRTIVIDPGHGGKDPGTSNKKLRAKEKTIALAIAKQLRKILKKYTDYKVVLTRETDRYISLEERTAIANSQKGDLFVSIHLNSAPRKSARGVETYYLSMTTDPWAMKVAAQENAVSTKSIG